MITCKQVFHHPHKLQRNHNAEIQIKIMEEKARFKGFEETYVHVSMPSSNKVYSSTKCQRIAGKNAYEISVLLYVRDS